MNGLSTLVNIRYKAYVVHEVRMGAYRAVLLAALIAVIWSSPTMAQSRQTAFPRSPYLDGMTVEQREQFIYGDEVESDYLTRRIHSLIGLDYSLIFLLPAAELLEWVETCIHLGAAGHSEYEINEMIQDLKKRQADLTKQWGDLTVQLQNYPQEWHRFQQTQIPWLQKQQQLRAQAAQRRAEAKQCKKTPPPPTTTTMQCPPGQYADPLFASQGIRWCRTTQPRQ